MMNMEGRAYQVQVALSSIILSLDYYCSSFLPAGVKEKVLLRWQWARAAVILPTLRVAVAACLVMSVMLLVDKLFMAVVSLGVRIFRRGPKKVYRWEPLGLQEEEDVEVASLAYPMVLVQIPLYNEREVYQVAIRAACSFSWPSDRLVIQVLDDSTDLITKELVKTECQKWVQKGINVNLEMRDNRRGYKAGAMREGMKCSYVQKCDYVAIFDADHQPESNFLHQTIPYLVHNPEVALVQARWKFVNADECLMTRIQEMSMDHHFKMEQQAGSSLFSFFGFNGTAGVWRIQAMKEAGGWNERSTVEDMDLAVRASLKGWKFIYDGSIKVRSELPSSFKAYRYQQHRWACGPANLFRKMVVEILIAKKVSIWKKLYIVYSFFFVRKVLSHHVTFIFYTLVIPITLYFPEVLIPKWGVIYVPSAITLINAVGTPSSLHLIFFWVFTEQAMSFHRLKAVYIGLLETGRAKEWVVTEKTGSKLKGKSSSTTAKKLHIKFWQRLSFVEVWIGLFLLGCAVYDYKYHLKSFFLYIFPQSITFLLLGFGCYGNFK